jgi:hypothetical protein
MMKSPPASVHELEAAYDAALDKRKHSATDPAELLKAFTFLGDTRASPPRMLIKGLLPAEGIAVTGGQSTAGKTFEEIFKAICLAKASPFFRHRIVERVGTAFIAAEGRALIPNRFAAALEKYSITDELPIAWINQIPDFTSSDGIKLFIQQLKALNKSLRVILTCALAKSPLIPWRRVSR